MEDFNDEMLDYDFDEFDFDPIRYHEPVDYLQRKWSRPLDYHEQYLVGEIYAWCRHNISVDEIKLVDYPLDPVISYDSTHVLRFDSIHHNAPIIYLSNRWQRPLTDHEMHIIVEIYDWCYTQMEIEEITFLKHFGGGEYLQ